MTIGNRLKTRRKDKKWTLKDVANLLEVSEATVQRYESDNIDIPHSKIERLAHLYDVSPNYLMGWNGEPNAEEWRLLSVIRHREDIAYICYKIISMPDNRISAVKSVIESFY